MLSLALLDKELNEQANRRQTYLLRIGYVITVFAIYSTVFFSVTSNAPLGGLSQGKHLFNTTLGLQWAAILLLLPALTSSVITDERARGTLDLLIVTQMGLAHILLQKYISRLVMILSLLLAALPLHAISFRSGGIESVQLIQATQVQFGACLLVAAMGLFSSSVARTTSSAMAVCFGLTIGSAFLLAAIYDLVPAFWLLMIQAVAAIGFLGATFHQTKTHRGEAPGLKSFARKPPTSGFMPGLALADAMQNAPIAWREHRRMGLGRSWAQRTLLTLEMLMVTLFLTIMLIGEIAQHEYLLWDRIPIIFFWYFVIIRLTVITVNTIARERMEQTMDPLLTTPMDSFQILYQKMIALHEYLRSLWLPFAVYYLGRVLIMGAFTTIDFSMYVLPYLILAGCCVWIYLPLFMWLAMWIGLKVPNRNKAILITLGIILIGSDVLLGVVELLTHMIGFGGYIITIPALLSPMAFIRRIEYLVFYHRIAGPITLLSTVLFSAAAFYLYARISRWLMRDCTNRAENLLRSDPH